MTAAAEAPPLSVECELAQRPGYEDVHGHCRQTTDIPLPHGAGLLLQRRCGCTCHHDRGTVQTSTPQTDTPTARVPMICGRCDQPIPPGEQYTEHINPGASGAGGTAYWHTEPCTPAPTRGTATRNRGRR